MRASQVNLLLTLSMALGLSGCFGPHLVPPPAAGYGCGYPVDPGCYGYGGYGHGGYGYGYGAYGDCVDPGYYGYGYDSIFDAALRHDRPSLRERLLARREARRDRREARRDRRQERRSRRHSRRHGDIGCDTYFEEGCDDCDCGCCVCEPCCCCCCGPCIECPMPTPCCGTCDPCIECGPCWDGAPCCDSCETGIIGEFPPSSTYGSFPPPTCAGGACPYHVEGGDWDGSPEMLGVPYSDEMYPSEAAPHPIDDSYGERYPVPPAQEGDWGPGQPESGGTPEDGPQAAKPIQNTLWTPPQY